MLRQKILWTTISTDLDLRSQTGWLILVFFNGAFVTHLSLVYPQMRYPTMFPLQKSWWAIVGFLSFSHTQWCCILDKYARQILFRTTGKPYVWRKSREQAGVVEDNAGGSVRLVAHPDISRSRQSISLDQSITVVWRGGKYEYCKNNLVLDSSFYFCTWNGWKDETPRLPCV